jgi:hypothetical protein
VWVELGDADMDFASVTLIAVALDAFKYSMAAHFSACFAMSDLAPLGLLRSQRCPPQNKGPAAKPAPGYAEANAHYRQLAQRFRPRQQVLACEQSFATAPFPKMCVTGLLPTAGSKRAAEIDWSQ